MTTTLYNEALTLALRLPRSDRLRLAQVLTSAAAAETSLWPPPAVIVRMPVTPEVLPTLLTGGAWDPLLPLRREELYNDRGRA
ncbi:MAG: hypothetical protein EI684_14415 [Candidatus Viridilinea halotolerans]|uniref:Uncharacterized protein n=1 Tax=Candidatus Viridilinea halotolerans TaxID=2491704 RepID=A0A426TWG6_9CHLR|nr:MAG: hypothetical protein EI684_14415 [Candidatus Viridilinea halotolerans]